MKDQAEKLRALIERNKNLRNKNEELNDTKKKKTSRLISISSGKGGVGKTNISLNLALALIEKGKKVSIIDADLGLANIDVLLGTIPKFNLSHVIKGDKKLKDIIIKGPNGLNIIPGGSGVSTLIDLPKEMINEIASSLMEIDDISDYILIDTGAGINSSVLSFIQASDELILLATSDPASITDAYAVVKNIEDKDKTISLVVNRCDSYKEGEEVYKKLKSAARRFLKIDIKLLGVVLEDKNVRISNRNQVPFIIEYKNSLASKCVRFLASKLEDLDVKIVRERAFTSFFKKMFEK